jgi:hypothetical protein
LIRLFPPAAIESRVTFAAAGQGGLSDLPFRRFGGYAPLIRFVGQTLALRASEVRIPWIKASFDLGKLSVTLFDFFS